MHSIDQSSLVFLLPLLGPLSHGIIHIMLDMMRPLPHPRRGILVVRIGQPILVDLTAAKVEGPGFRPGLGLVCNDASLAECLCTGLHGLVWLVVVVIGLCFCHVSLEFDIGGDMITDLLYDSNSKSSASSLNISKGTLVGAATFVGSVLAGAFML